jgi:AcrR family transcriptional regulator
MDERQASGRRARRDAQQNLERVLQAAQELFAARGGEVTMEEVARRAGVGVGTVYRRFANKEELFAAVSREACNSMRDCLRSLTVEHANPLARLRELIHLQYQRCAHQAALLELQPGARADEQRCGTRREQQQLYATLHLLVQQAIVDGQRQGLMRPGDPAALATLVLELLSPRAYRTLAATEGDDVEALADLTTQFIFGALGVRQP